jgi:hypothetical protein
MTRTSPGKPRSPRTSPGKPGDVVATLPADPRKKVERAAIEFRTVIEAR